jgi:predicted HicB family RNase H-like nuclease
MKNEIIQQRVTVNVCVPDDLHQKLAVACSRTGLSMDALLISVLTRDLSRTVNKIDRACSEK